MGLLSYVRAQMRALAGTERGWHEQPTRHEAPVPRTDDWRDCPVHGSGFTPYRGFVHDAGYGPDEGWIKHDTGPVMGHASVSQGGQHVGYVEVRLLNLPCGWEAGQKGMRPFTRRAREEWERGKR